MKRAPAPTACLTTSASVRVRDAARFLGVSHRSLNSRAWRLKHGVPALRLGRALVFDLAQLEAWLHRHSERRPRLASDGSVLTQEGTR